MRALLQRWDRRTRRTPALLGAVSVAAVIGLLILPAIRGGGGGVGTLPVAGSGGVPGAMQTRFTFLAAQHTNFCALQPAAVLGYLDEQRMQGSCCNPMDLGKYQSQVQGLKRYEGLAEVPTDPYDIRAGLAKALLGYDRSIVLSATNKATFDAAMQLTADKGPCCCHCWRWTMTDGLDKRLITTRHMGAAEVARITDLTNGCGGPMDNSARNRASSTPH